MTDNELRDLAHRVARAILAGDLRSYTLLHGLSLDEEAEVWRLVTTAQVIIGA